MCLLACCVLFAQAGATPGLPPQPDFSGRWTLVTAQPSDAGVAKALNVHQTVRPTNVRGQPMAPFFSTIEIERQFDAATNTETHLIGVGGGTVGGLLSARGGARTIPPPVQSHYAVTWDLADSRTLVIENGTYTGDTPGSGDWTERRETWTLQPNGELAITIATSGSTHPARTASATYRRRH